jgi:hypothetical protein
MHRLPGKVIAKRSPYVCKEFIWFDRFFGYFTLLLMINVLSLFSFFFFFSSSFDTQLANYSTLPLTFLFLSSFLSPRLLRSCLTPSLSLFFSPTVSLSSSLLSHPVLLLIFEYFSYTRTLTVWVLTFVFVFVYSPSVIFLHKEKNVLCAWKERK